ncbi:MULTISPECIES: DUF475 domain-containing protein [unclassified Janthinobacterium]|uniref:DUF475 domain-containing protein n=1 Tax=unclassified Janthinobacterium TaxID=2610881 RepID=UPI00160B3B8B|nr:MULTISPECIES: DUF475 domain-containing protein [unclassified Janthinobacterium]MBB5369406.1 hypothetical protein [Janthinobacterium sp. K2C7]MBB5381058.1 hypothetical protein [Janthinobacterium sp. K2Li3]MBB5387789.1 hypothetical protein [Janthinobacterium sp. K2E3]
MQHFRLSFIVTFLLMAVAGWWGYSHGGVPGLLQALWITGVLGIMEVSLSFDNAVVNASVLRHWNEFWQKLFLTVGILVAVFGMRLLFPLVIVSVATGEGLLAVWTMATTTPDIYAQHLTNNHAQVAAFGGAFLLLVFLNFLFDDEKELHWLGWAEEKVNALGTESLAVLITMGAVAACVSMGPEAQKYSVLASGLVGIAVYIGVNWISGLLEENEPDLQDEDDEENAAPAKSGNGDLIKTVARGSIGGFLYLEVLDASFSFDGVIGAFAITNDVVIIMLGLAIGAMFVRSMTVFLVHKGTLDEFVYLEHGAHYAIGILALIMFASVKYHIPEWFTGLSGVAFILVSLWSSLRHRKQQAALA